MSNTYLAKFASKMLNLSKNIHKLFLKSSRRGGEVVRTRCVLRTPISHFSHSNSDQLGVSTFQKCSKFGVSKKVISDSGVFPVVGFRGFECFRVEETFSFRKKKTEEDRSILKTFAPRMKKNLSLFNLQQLTNLAHQRIRLFGNL